MAYSITNNATTTTLVYNDIYAVKTHLDKEISPGSFVMSRTVTSYASVSTLASQAPGPWACDDGGHAGVRPGSGLAAGPCAQSAVDGGAAARSAAR